MKKVLAVLLAALILAGCKQETVHSGTEGFITQFEKDDRLLIGDVIYEIDHDTQIQTEDGDRLKKKDLKLGMKIKPFYEGKKEQVFPSRAHAKLLLIQNDPESLKETSMIINVLRQLRHNEDEHFIITKMVHKDDEDAYIMNVMRRSNVDIGSTITVDEHSYEILYMEA
ncbi:hypothetical protein [Bacillus sp. 1P06AnD]|uniref:hypothetical protein n=1 Tax=Bacillus sp. 1P06AnD TaxID=3132208 RepID=UPI0039A06B4D